MTVQPDDATFKYTLLKGNIKPANVTNPDVSI